ncbi:hypothetical protein ACFQDN_21895 [Pseudomonas asuensis]|uniref:Uncharacterized protein n=1 Tax=Pseudomonas asuensis TaxID=1825787 RepID=A0ABQ2H2E0_9PSED|nr:hypothetical protein [Pseudomonas asuensis]GGM25450.1 hypothetical protein GCM10009425_40240 [Pseudomonas asuensis]
MRKRKVVSITEAWCVWTGEKSAVRLVTKSEALELLNHQGQDCAVTNSYFRFDMACPVAQILWNEPLEEGKTHHKIVTSPQLTVLRKGQLRTIIHPLPPSKFKSISKAWYDVESQHIGWWPEQYITGINDPDTLVLRGSKPLTDQIDARWPIPRS